MASYSRLSAVGGATAPRAAVVLPTPLCFALSLPPFGPSGFRKRPMIRPSSLFTGYSSVSGSSSCSGDSGEQVAQREPWIPAPLFAASSGSLCAALVSLLLTDSLYS